MAFVQRKKLRLQDYDYNNSGMYFITFCTKDNALILGNIVGSDDPGAPQMRLSEKGKIVRSFIESIEKTCFAQVIKYVIMPNHVHLLVQIHTNERTATPRQTAAVPRMMAALKRFCNQQIGESVFQRSYHDHVVRNEADFLRIWEYIDNNPQKWQIDRYYVEKSFIKSETDASV